MTTPLTTVLAYHERTKHYFERYAAGPGGLDWASQPDPFRRFTGCAVLDLPLLNPEPPARYADLYLPGETATQPLTMPNVAALLELSLGISAWKNFGSAQWALRCNPSSGNLHPTEGYIVAAGCPGIVDGVHHYVSRDHRLERRCTFAAAVDGQSLLPPTTFLVGLTSIHWREAWKYGERAFRYCQHDVGHAIAAVRYAAAVLGWRVQLLAAWGDTEINALLGTDRDQDFGSAEREHPDLMLLVDAAATDTAINITPAALLGAVRHGQWQGQANILSPQHRHQWPVIDDVAAACIKPPTNESSRQSPSRPEPIATTSRDNAAAIIKQRRSAQAFDGVTSLAATAFFRMLDMTLPRAATAPWDTVTWDPRIHLLLFVHRVDGLDPGLYLFLRNDTVESLARAELSSGFAWAPVTTCPKHFALFQLASVDVQDTARAVSCYQDIAGDGAFSVAMLAEFATSLDRGAWIYRHLFWEAGILGQVLYLEAEAAGVRGTGIGCYFDDGVHEVLGIKKTPSLQSLYHFTMGGALADRRLITLPAYAHLVRGRPAQ